MDGYYDEIRYNFSLQLQVLPNVSKKGGFHVISNDLLLLLSLLLVFFFLKTWCIIVHLRIQGQINCNRKK